MQREAQRVQCIVGIYILALGPVVSPRPAH